MRSGRNEIETETRETRSGSSAQTASTLFVLAVAVQTKAKLQAVRDDTLPSKRKADGSGSACNRGGAGKKYIKWHFKPKKSNSIQQNQQNSQKTR